MHEHPNQERPSVRMFLTNLHVRMPLHRKIWLVLRNNMKKILTGSSCCCHPGEPGC
ncbi:MAG: hypothetical protein A4E61_01124 [Syntrophorhabdus sp. PtaB.Bin184]|nr:MAG: hypothetical protein A4E61_01124 [Syntrophorhabdus sp. PtaB.Bin184]